MSAEFSGGTNLQVTIGAPATVANSGQESTETNTLNLFFYRVEPSGFYADAGAQDRWYVRASCLITAFSIDDTTSTPNVSAGEGDLRLLGEVLRYFNENPIIVPKTDEDDIGSRVQAVFTPLSSEEINQIWSTQGDVPYRPSLRYEFSLLPIEPRERATPPLPVVARGLNLQTRANVADARRAPPVLPAAWISPHMEIGTEDDWVPALSYVSGGVATQSISFAAAPDLKVPVWIAGRPGAAVRLVWQRINRGVWEPVPGAGGAIDAVVPAQPVPPGQGVIDPASAGAAAKVDVAVPVPTDLPAYLLLFAQRPGAGGTVLRSNPLILTVRA
jgi:hypothetical protein